jgi:hypothetical protein
MSMHNSVGTDRTVATFAVGVAAIALVTRSCGVVISASCNVECRRTLACVEPGGERRAASGKF